MKKYPKIVDNTKYFVEEYYDINNYFHRTYYLNNKIHHHNDAASYSYKDDELIHKSFFKNGKLHNDKGFAVYYKFLLKEPFEEVKTYWINGIYLNNVTTDEELKEYLKYKNF